MGSFRKVLHSAQHVLTLFHCARVHKREIGSFGIVMYVDSAFPKQCHNCFIED
ncbi:unnamed protein product [Acanthoscelides obtectus]|uniref:Uncharacterized protein n=1 Tax=Acanthoscelides obtectus TaxID=200917 RepID=A0A9P0KPW6_ACAOB|nr:unnamed protein product [Acanthoscelides obtectus]CAK1667716.1 hypothetical protein AOBTE_LOCUS26005 [Acanthoscelides obtectus]